MPAQTDRVKLLRKAAEPGTIPYVSKSRVLKWKKCPESFNFSYLKGFREPETGAMRRGTNIHESIEDYYYSVAAYVEERGEFPPDLVDHLPDSRRWSDYLEPFITNFLKFEYERMEVSPDPESWLPAAVEAEEWLDDPLGYGDEAIPWMGYADVIYHDTSVPGVAPEGGVVIIDFKTGKTPSEKYRDDGIYLQGEYYAMLFESEWSVTAVGGYYPKNHDLIISPLKDSRRQVIEEIVHEMQAVSGENPAHLKLEEQPLCKWGPGPDEQCPFYNMCGSSWGEGLKHEDRFRALIQGGYTNREIATDLGMSAGAVNYTKFKLGLK